MLGSTERGSQAQERRMLLKHSMKPTISSLYKSRDSKAMSAEKAGSLLK